MGLYLLRHSEQCLSHVKSSVSAVVCRVSRYYIKYLVTFLSLARV